MKGLRHPDPVVPGGLWRHPCSRAVCLLVACGAFGCASAAEPPDRADGGASASDAGRPLPDPEKLIHATCNGVFVQFGRILVPCALCYSETGGLDVECSFAHAQGQAQPADAAAPGVGPAPGGKPDPKTAPGPRRP